VSKPPNRMIQPQDRFRIKEVRVHQAQPRRIPPDWPRTHGPNRYIVYADSQAVERIMSHARVDTRIECFGILLGNAYIDEDFDLTWIYLQDFVSAEYAHSDSVSVEVSREEFQRINNEVDRIRERSNGRIRKIGWYHSHPNFGIFMSNTDRLNQRRYYNQEWQIAMVVDPIRANMGFFHGGNSNRCPHRVVETRMPMERTPEVTVNPPQDYRRPERAAAYSKRKPAPRRRSLWKRLRKWLVRVLDPEKGE